MRFVLDLLSLSPKVTKTACSSSDSHRNKHPRGRKYAPPGSRAPVVAEPDRLVAHEAAVTHFHPPNPPRGDGAAVILGDVAHEGGISHGYVRGAGGAAAGAVYLSHPSFGGEPVVGRRVA